MARKTAASRRDLVLLVARVVLVSGLLVSGYKKLAFAAGAAEYLERMGVPFASVALAHILGVVEVAGALAVMAGWRARIAGVVLATYIIPVTWFAHLSVAWASGDLMVKDQETYDSLKSLGIAAGLLLLSVAGPGRHSVDGN
jgi:putative oxidoreductase